MTTPAARIPRREIMLFNIFGRETPPAVIGDWLQAVEESDVVDYYGVYDNLVAWMPASLWRELSPNVELVPDIDSYYDPAFLLGLASARTKNLGIAMNATNAARNGPAEVLRLALSLSNARPGRSFLGIGAGEAYNIRPFGYD
jgi:phthiodiolone/phenolphthiodiolone dimycocerosates ketoreductase